MEFYARNKYPETIACPECSKFVDTFSLEIDKATGKKELKKTGKTNLYEKIQKSKEETLIYNILDRYQNGDTQVIEKHKGVYGDFTNMPKTLAEAQQILINAEKTFMQLPLEERKKYNHNISEFLAEISKVKIEEIKTPTNQEIIEQQQKQIEELKQGGQTE